MEFNQFGIRFIYFMIVKWVFLNFNMFVYFLIRELENKYCNIDLWKLVLVFFFVRMGEGD